MTTTVPGAASARHTAAEVEAPAMREPNDDAHDGVSWVVMKAVLFVVGCALLVACAFALDRLGAWSADYGRVWVFLGFFLVMSLGGRWFWAGADAAIGWVKAQVRR